MSSNFLGLGPRNGDEIMHKHTHICDIGGRYNIVQGTDVIRDIRHDPWYLWVNRVGVGDAEEVEDDIDARQGVRDKSGRGEEHVEFPLVANDPNADTEQEGVYSWAGRLHPHPHAHRGASGPLSAAKATECKTGRGE